VYALNITQMYQSVLTRKNASTLFGGGKPMEDANCIAAYFMNESLVGGDEADQSGNNENLTETSGDIPTSADVPSGYSGTSRDFENGETEWLEANDGGSTDISGADQELTICYWVKLEDSFTSATRRIITKWNGSWSYSSHMWWGSGSTATGRMSLNSGGGEGHENVSTGDSLTPGTWYHCAYVYDDVNMKSYLNGVYKNSTAHADGFDAHNDDFRIGAEADDDNPHDGLLDEVILFSRALSLAEINYIKDNGISGDKGGSD